MKEIVLKEVKQSFMKFITWKPVWKFRTPQQKYSCWRLSNKKISVKYDKNTNILGKFKSSCWIQVLNHIMFDIKVTFMD